MDISKLRPSSNIDDRRAFSFDTSDSLGRNMRRGTTASIKSKQIGEGDDDSAVVVSHSVNYKAPRPIDTAIRARVARQITDLRDRDD